MDIGSILLILALLVLVGLFVSRPFFEKKLLRTAAGPVSQEEHDLSALMAERDRIITALQELDFDYALEKIPAEDYPAQRASLLQRGADVLRRLDTIQPLPTQQEKAEDAEARLEAAIAARRADLGRMQAAAATGGTRPVANLGSPDDEIEAILAKRRRDRREKASGFCPQCGMALQVSDRFCPRCGKKLA
jgi:hypothetical protein